MKIGEIIEVEGVKYIAEIAISKNGINCFSCSFYNINCGKIVKETNCVKSKIIFVKIPLELLRKIEELEEDVEILQHNYNCKKSENEIMHKRLKLLTHYLKLQGYTDTQINEIIKLRGE